MIRECKLEAMPKDLQEEIRMFKKALAEGASHVDCWADEVQGSVNQYYICKVISKEVRDWLYENYVDKWEV